MRPFEAPLMKVLAEPQLPSEVKFHSSVLKFGDLPDGNSNTLAVEVPLSGSEIREDPNAGLFSAHVSIVAEIKNKAGIVIEHFSEDIPRHGALETVDKVHSDVVTLQRHFVAGPGEYVAEVAIQDRNNGKFSAQRTSFKSRVPRQFRLYFKRIPEDCAVPRAVADPAPSPVKLMPRFV